VEIPHLPNETPTLIATIKQKEDGLASGHILRHDNLIRNDKGRGKVSIRKKDYDAE